MGQEIKEAPRGKSFSDVHSEFRDITSLFMASMSYDRSLNSLTKTSIIYNLGVIKGINETLLKAYFFGPADAVLDKSENIKHYAAIMLKLVTLYEDYRSGKKVNAFDLLEAIEDIEFELLGFVREVMKQLR